ncbi:hypothetical protein PSP6_270058 [Paraburkholderia tropica]|uniref:hypothetical protein n=1 Tax=Paraburkholderia tropica TaxID=92647 RepID=UPI001CB5C1B9|nr:hypothetical protein [Paraburkholderia tropica]CAG9207710.1 hypothetical protein PSP6_270058 [Paraburkholderia tropica]
MTAQTVSILNEIGQLYAFDANDFAERFDVTWERITNKTGRIKSFVDLLMGFECALKAHIALAGQRDLHEPKQTYMKIRKASHSISQLASAATLLSDRGLYEQIAGRLDSFSVLIRYSLDAYEAFFPWYTDQGSARINYSMTIGNDVWIRETRELLEPLMDSAYKLVTGEVADIEHLFDREREMQEFVETVVAKGAR